MQMPFQANPRRALALALASAVLLMGAASAAAAEVEEPRHFNLLASCTNNKTDGLETGTDCGGPKCPPCGPGKECKSNKDCQTNLCLGTVCAFGPKCSNGIRDSDETDIDCGGINSGCLPCCWSKTCRINSDCKSGSCADGRCAEAKHCDSLGVSDEQRKFGSHLHHHDPITCGQCVCKDCPVNTTFFTYTVTGGCNDTNTIIAIAELEAAVIAFNGEGTQVGIYCLDNPGRRSLLAGATLYGSACSGLTFVLPPGTALDPTRPVIEGECNIDPGPSPAPPMP